MKTSEKQEAEWERDRNECYERWREDVIARATNKALSLGRNRHKFYEHLKTNYSQQIASLVAKRVMETQR